MKRLIFLLGMMISVVVAWGQKPIHVSQPYVFHQWVDVKGSVYLDSLLASSDSSNRAASTKWVKQNIHGGGGGGTTTNALTQGYGINSFSFNGGTAGVTVSADTLYSANNLATQYYAKFVAGNDQILTGMVTTVVTTTATTTAGQYRLLNVVHVISTTNTTIPAQDPTQSQWVVLYATTSGTIGQVDGTLALTDPVIPDPPANTLEIAMILIQPTSITTNGGGNTGIRRLSFIAPSAIFTVTGSPATSATSSITLTAANETAHTFAAGPTSGSPAAWTFRAMVAGDLPTVTTAPTASTYAGWDANSNFSANQFIPKLTSTATAAGTTTLTVSSTQIQLFTGTTTQTVNLPVASTLANGEPFQIINTSTGTVTVKTSGGTTVQAMAGGTELDLIVANSGGGTGTASWNWKYSLQAGSVPAGTSGSVAFYNSTGSNITQDNANFFWDDTHLRLGLNMNGVNPVHTLDLAGAISIYNGSSSGQRWDLVPALTIVYFADGTTGPIAGFTDNGIVLDGGNSSTPQTAQTARINTQGKGTSNSTKNLYLTDSGNTTLLLVDDDGSFTGIKSRTTGQTTLVAGTKAITLTGVTTSSIVIVSLVSQGGTTTTTAAYEGVATSNTITINAVTNAGTDSVNTLDTSIVNYWVVN